MLYDLRNNSELLVISKKKKIIIKWVSKWVNEILKWYQPHDHDDKFHHNLIEDAEEFNHESGLLSHLPHADAKCNKETNQTCDRKS